MQGSLRLMSSMHGHAICASATKPLIFRSCQMDLYLKLCLYHVFISPSHTTYIYIPCSPLVREITFENGEALTEEGLPFLILFYDPNNLAPYVGRVNRSTLGCRSMNHSCLFSISVISYLIPPPSPSPSLPLLQCAGVHRRSEVTSCKRTR